MNDARYALMVANDAIDEDLLLKLAARYGRATLEELKKLLANSHS